MYVANLFFVLSGIFIKLGSDMIEISVSLLEDMSNVEFDRAHVLKGKCFNRDFYRKGIHIFLWMIFQIYHE